MSDMTAMTNAAMELVKCDTEEGRRSGAYKEAKLVFQKVLRQYLDSSIEKMKDEILRELEKN